MLVGGSHASAGLAAVSGTRAGDSELATTTEDVANEDIKSSTLEMG